MKMGLPTFAWALSQAEHFEHCFEHCTCDWLYDWKTGRQQVTGCWCSCNIEIKFPWLLAYGTEVFKVALTSANCGGATGTPSG